MPNADNRICVIPLQGVRRISMKVNNSIKAHYYKDIVVSDCCNTLVYLIWIDFNPMHIKIRCVKCNKESQVKN